MLSRVTRVSVLTTTIGAVTLLAGGCATSSTGSAGATKPSSTAPLSPQQAVDLAATKTNQVNSLAATYSLQATTPTGAIDAAGSIQEQIRPTVLAEANFTTFSEGGQSLPGGLAEVITPKAVYMKSSSFSQALNTTKPWAEFPLASGGALTALIDQIQSSSPVTQTQMLGGATNVRKVGTGVVDGVQVTEYEGSAPFSQALAKLPAALRAQVKNSAVGANGIKTVSFKIWLDAQQLPRKVVVTETGPSINETVTENISGYNQPVNVTVPTAAETYVIPASMGVSLG